MGGGLLQQINRDTLGWAMKTSSARVDGYWRDVYKDPITSVSKRSKRGRLALVHHQGSYMTVREDELAEQNNILQDVFLNGELLIDDDLTTIRERTKH